MIDEIKRSEARFTSFDLDSEALNFAMNRLSYTDLSPEYIQFFKYNALRMFDHELNMEEFGLQDIIYSVGYFDYLPDDFLVKMQNDTGIRTFTGFPTGMDSSSVMRMISIDCSIRRKFLKENIKD